MSFGIYFMQNFTLTAALRTATGRKTYGLRAEGIVPAVVYGAVEKTFAIQMDRGTFIRLYKEAGESSLIELQIEGQKPLHVLIQDIQVDALRGEVIHADFLALDMTKKVETGVKLRFIGESVAIKSLGGILVHPVDEILVRALPKDLPQHIDVDLSALATFEDAVQLKDLAAIPGVEFLGDVNQTVALVAAPRSEEELAELSKAVEVDVTKVEVVAKKKEAEEGEESADGASTTIKAAPAKKEEKSKK